LAKSAAAVTGLRLCRVDIRLAQDGTPYVVEVNANPYLENTAEFAVAALQAGMAYSTLINKIVEIAWNRFKNEESRSKLAHIKKELIKKETEKTNS
jgi:hypothetical protein